MTPETLLTLSAVILFLPLLGFLILIFWGKRIGKPSGIIGTAILGLDLLLALFVAYYKLFVYDGLGMIQTKFTWVTLGFKDISLGIGIDNLAALMLIVVTLISFLVHLFSNEYMSEDPRFPRFFSYLGLFTFSMLGIVIANNLLNMYIFWELVGISSYLLIGFWYEKKSASDAGKKAFITNRIGDLGFLGGILIIFANYQTLMFDDIFEQISLGVYPYESAAMLTLAGILIFCGAIGKSAQFPLHVWLPDAMEGPTPVSALIHAATMVAAGVYMTARVFPMFTADAFLFIAYIGAFTAFMSATIAITQNDFKRVLAYSTVSQLGYMVMALGVGAYTTGFFHLVTHAWFKACLFLASGSVIHAMHHAMHHAHNHDMDPQDIRNMGGLRKTMPKTYFTFLFATIALAGVPLTSGFLSKDGILAATLAFGSLSGHWLIPVAGFAAAGMTAFYMFRLTIEAFHGEPKTDIAAKTHENNWIIVFPLVLLAVLSLWFFYSPNPTDPTKGWFYQKLQQPATAVNAEYQWDFLVPYSSPDAVESHEVQMAINEHEATAEHAGHNHGAHEAVHASSGEHGEAKAVGHHAFNKFEEETHHWHLTAMIMSLCIAGCGILIAFIIYQFKIISSDNLARQFRPLYNISYNKWYFDEIYDATAIGGTMLLAKISGLFDNKIVDGIVNLSATITRLLGYATGFFDLYFVDGIINLIAKITGFFGVVLRKVQTGSVQTYIVFVIVGLMVLLYYVI